jgi:hypothetical protein
MILQYQAPSQLPKENKTYMTLSDGGSCAARKAILKNANQTEFPAPLCWLAVSN